MNDKGGDGNLERPAEGAAENGTTATERLATLRLWLGFAKFILGTVAIGVLTATLNYQIQARTIAIQEQEQRQEYVKKFVEQALDDNLEKRVRFAHYFSSLLGSRWDNYFEGVRREYDTKLRELEKIREEERRVAAQPGAVPAIQSEQLRQRIAELEHDVKPRSLESDPLLGFGELKRKLGNPVLRAEPTPDDPTRVVVDPDWVSKNIIEVEIPQLAGVTGFPSSNKIKFHRDAAESLKAAFAELQSKGLIDKILSFDGGWVVRSLSHQPAVFSNHAFGTAFDINAPWNVIGTNPAALGAKGSVRELVPVFERHGFVWGGNNAPPDGSHFIYVPKN